MSASRRGSSSRRSFLKTLPAAVAATVAAPALAPSQTPATTDAVTSDALAVAQQIVGVELPAAERETARVLVARNRDNIEQLRRVAIPSERVTMTNLTGHPAMVVPAGFVDNMPVALMVTGRLWDEAGVLRVAAAFEGATDWHLRHPKL